MECLKIMVCSKNSDLMWFCLKNKTDENVVSLIYNYKTNERLVKKGAQNNINNWVDSLSKLGWEIAKLPDIQFTQEDGTKKIFTGEELLNNIIIQ